MQKMDSGRSGLIQYRGLFKQSIQIFDGGNVCKMTMQWPDDIPVPQAWLEFDVDSVERRRCNEARVPDRA